MTNDQPICETQPGGLKEWTLYGHFHRIDGPAREWSTGCKEWWLDGRRHRSDGPAYEGANGYKEWWLNGEEVAWQEVYHAATTDEDRVSILYHALT